MEPNDLAYLAGQIAQGNVILFTGAGFSLCAQAEDGHSIPSAGQLLQELWPLVYGDTDYDGSTLADVYGAAERQHGNATRELLARRLKVSRENLPDEYRIWLSFPWYRIYTVNVDNLEDIVQVDHDLPRKIRSVSALSEPPPPPTTDLIVVHLNGTVDDLPNVTFSSRNYAERQARPDLWYPALVRELTAHPVLFVGSTLDEPSLWQYIEARPPRARGTRELRPKSFLVAPKLSLGRQSLLGEFNIRFLEGTQEAFCAETLSQLADAAKQGVEYLRAASAAGIEPALLSATELSAAPLEDAPELLTGRAPRWADVASGFAIERAFDRETLVAIGQDNVRLVLLTGTAGCGKTLSAMRIAMAIAAGHRPAYVYNEDFTGNIHAIRDAANDVDAGVVIIDNPHRFGRSMVDFLTALVEDSPDRVVIVTMRTTRRDGAAMAKLKEAGAVEFPVPPLADSDINALLDALTESRRLGDLREKGRAEQVAVFRNKCGRQLLVAMIEATSGLRFDELIASECAELDGHGLLVYAVMTLASSFGTSLTRSEVLTACGGDPASVNAGFQGLVDQHLAIVDGKGRFAIRHRVIAEKALTYFQDHRSLGSAIEGLAFALASTAQPFDRYGRQRRLLGRLLNHATLIQLLFPKTPQQIDKEAVRSVYVAVEQLLGDDPHFWLQRGSFEVEEGDLGLARNYLSQARAMAPDDVLVLTEWAYLLLKRASQHAAEPGAAEEAQEAFALLEEVITSRGERDSHAFHIYGSQGLAWIKRSPMGTGARASGMERLREVVRRGVELHPDREDLRTLLRDLDREYMMLAVSPANI